MLVIDGRGWGMRFDAFAFTWYVRHNWRQSLRGSFSMVKVFESANLYEIRYIP